MKYIFCLIIALTGCSEVDVSSIKNLNNGKVDVIGHGGSGFQSLVNPTPSNSLESVKKAIDGYNADGMEIDIQLTADNIPVLFHDDMLEISTNCTGCANQMQFSVITDCQYRNHYSSAALNPQNIVSLEEVISYFSGRQYPPDLYLNTKMNTICGSYDTSHYRKVITAVSALVKKHNAYDWVFLFESTAGFYNVANDVDPEIKWIFSVEDHFEEFLQFPFADSIETIIAEHTDISPQEVQQAHNQNVKVILWGIRSRNDVVDALKKHPDGLLTDNIPLTQKSLQK